MRKMTMRKILASLLLSVNGFIEAANGEPDWATAEDDERERIREIVEKYKK
jgi:hypothetical protein